jgi:2-polyprenyl-6-hydroxyphenyl methylase/3-demethylubiquinone-9 3-methyltransferase
MKVWDFELPAAALTMEQAEYMKGLPAQRPTLEWVWGEMDRVWKAQGLTNQRSPNSQALCTYYSHPVWLMNGVFAQTDPASVEHRCAIAAYIAKSGANRVADFGGGMGGLARAIARKNADISVDIIEPFQSELARNLIADLATVRYRSAMDRKYPVIVAQDVLEHVEDPVGLALHLAACCEPEGSIIFANCFYPVIQCHLPGTFFLRRTFKYVMGALGLRFVGPVQGAEHALVFQRGPRIAIPACRRAEVVARPVGVLCNLAAGASAKMRRVWSRR